MNRRNFLKSLLSVVALPTALVTSAVAIPKILKSETVTKTSLMGVDEYQNGLNQMECNWNYIFPDQYYTLRYATAGEELIVGDPCYIRDNVIMKSHPNFNDAVHGFSIDNSAKGQYAGISVDQSLQNHERIGQTVTSDMKDAASQLYLYCEREPLIR
jgi:hypothetical protein